MSEAYRIAAQPTGEPLPRGRVGVCVRVQLSGSPSARWSRAFTAHLVNELTGHPHVGYLSLKNLVQADQVVLEGVEEGEAPQLGDSLLRALEAANQTIARADDRERGGKNVQRSEATEIARRVGRP